MPLYEYTCKNSHKTEILRRPDEREKIIKCPVCESDAVQIISRTAPPVFKTSGFYATDYRSKTN